MIPQLLGGIGLFLIGMTLTTEGLRAAAGEQLRIALLRFTGGPIKALLSGATVTALVQSSSVTTVAVIGFVGAGLLTFNQALGVIFGANIGTTATGWLVAGIGLKLDMVAVALPLVGVGALAKLFLRGRASDGALALAGFGLIFVGVGVMQEGMQGLSGRLTPAELPGDSFGGRLLLIAIGALLTSLMQSSSAAVATTLTALHSGSISLNQGAAMVIGVNIGTTVTAGLAAIGASTSAKRAALAHFAFNVLPGIVAFAALPLFVSLAQGVGSGDAATALTAFHTAFNIVGVLLVLPFTRPFAKLVERAIAEQGPYLTRHLDVNATRLGGLAMEAVRQTSLEMAQELFETLQQALAGGAMTDALRTRLEAVSAAEESTLRFMGELRGAEPMPAELRARHTSTLHALDHIESLVNMAIRLEKPVFSNEPKVVALSAKLQEGLAWAVAWTKDPTHPSPAVSVKGLSEELAADRKRLRLDILDRTARAELSAAAASEQIEAIRRLDEIGYYLWRITEHLKGERLQAI